MRDILKDHKVFDIDLYKLRSRHFYRDLLDDRGKTLEELRTSIKNDNDFICPLCGSSNKEFYLDYQDYKLFECRNCSATSPNLNFEELDSLAFHASDLIKEDLKREILDTWQYRKETFAPERLNYIKDIIPEFGTNERVLDVGCGPGYFLSHLKDQGISAKGLEINPTCVAVCQDHDLNVASTNLIDENKNSYSLITMFDVLEHLTNPIKTIQEANNLLMTGGHLLAYTPNIHSLSTHLMGGIHSFLAVFNHLCFFDKKSLDYLAENTGFEVVKIEYFGLDVMDYLAYKEYSEGHAYFEHLREMTNAIQAIIDRAQLSNSMRVLFKKVR